MSHMIEGIQVTEDHIGDPVTYIPNHAKVTLIIREHGTISSFNESCLFVRYRSACGRALRRTY
jgi:hypothetical protein